MQRIAKVLSRAGIASRREAERFILQGLIKVNGSLVLDPATKVSSKDSITFMGKVISSPDVTRLWRYHKPAGLVSTNSDEKGRATIYDALPSDLPRLMSIGRLDLTSEGLLLLTNDGGLKRYLELPSTGFARKYRVRVNGVHDELLLNKLRLGISIDRERFRPIEVKLDRIKGSNVWYHVTLKEGRNREIRRSFALIGMTVNRLIRTSFGAFELGSLVRGEIKEIPTKVFMEHLDLDKAFNKKATTEN